MGKMVKILILFPLNIFIHLHQNMLIVVNVQNDEILDIEHFFVHFVPKKVQLH